MKIEHKCAYSFTLGVLVGTLLGVVVTVANMAITRYIQYGAPTHQQEPVR